MATLFCVFVFWLTIKICYLLHRTNLKSIAFSKLCRLDSGLILWWSWIKIYLIIIRGIYGFQLETIHRHREQSLYSSYDVIYTLYTLCTMNLRIGSISLGQICHVHYFLWLSPIQIRKEGGGGVWVPIFGKNNLRCQILGVLPPWVKPFACQNSISQ